GEENGRGWGDGGMGIGGEGDWDGDWDGDGAKAAGDGVEAGWGGSRAQGAEYFILLVLYILTTAVDHIILECLQQTTEDRP
ncbi:MAG: hypothetical protein AAB074_23665, partial [Planctomycetota bacterium]